MHNPCPSLYFESESHQMKLALSFQSQILLVFLPGRKGKLFHTLSLIQKRKKKTLSSLLLQGKAIPDLDREDHGLIQHSPPSPPCFTVIRHHPSSSAGGLMIHILLRLYMSMQLWGSHSY